MKNSKFVFAVFFAVILCLPTLSSGADVDSLVRGNTEFALDMYSELKTEKGNIFFSPYSISAAMGMVYAGARGETEEQIVKTLRFSSDQQHVHPAFAEIFTFFTLMNTKVNEVQKKRDEKQKEYDAAAKYAVHKREYVAALEEEKTDAKRAKEYEPWYSKWFKSEVQNKVSLGTIAKYAEEHSAEYAEERAALEEEYYALEKEYAGKCAALEKESWYSKWFAGKSEVQKKHDAALEKWCALEKKVEGMWYRGKSEPLKLSFANSLWPQQDYKLSEDYLALTKKYYGDSITPVDYQRASEEARKQINKWVSDKTENKINDIIQPGTFDNLTRLVLVNAVCFKGAWEHPFKKTLTKDAPFHLSSSESVKVPMMTQEKYFNYVDTGDGLQILELPYVGSDLSMLVLLPKEIDGLEQLESRLSFESLKNRRRSLKNSEVIVFLPKFRMTSAFGLNAVLQKMGMIDAFNMGKADFAGMNGRNCRDDKLSCLYIYAAIHKAYVDVNEEGTEAAAAIIFTGKGAGYKPPSPVFRADHPFLFLIQERQTGSILFMGRVTDPSKTGE